MKALVLLISLCLGCSLANANSIEQRFNTAKNNANHLYALLKTMPKGGELHYHLAGGAYPETMLNLATKSNYCLNTTTFTISSSENCEGISTSDLVSNPSLYPQIIRAWSMKDFVAGVESGHDHFFASFFKFMKIVVDNQVPLLAEVMQRAASQNELYMEIMILPDNARSTQFPKDPLTDKDYDSWRQRLLSNPDFTAEIDKTVDSSDKLFENARQYLHCEEIKEQAVCKLQVRFQYYILREQPLNGVFAQALHAFEAASRSKALVGVNFVQAEDGVISLRDYHQQMQIFNYLHALYPKVNIALHAGELAPSAVEPDNLRFHIRDAILTGHAQRIGHGVDIGYEDEAADTLKILHDKQIPVEINLTSNEAILNIAGEQHPFMYYLFHEVPVVLSTDDEGILRTDLTREYVKAVMTYDLSYSDLKQINRNALTYSFLPGKSIWSNAASATRVSECKQLESDTCKSFRKLSEKAQLQYQLEVALQAFEK